MNSISGRTRRRPPLVWLAIPMALAVLAAVSYLVAPRVTDDDFVAEFSSATGLYVGDEVKIMGVTVGGIDAIEPVGDKVRVHMHVDKDQAVPADARAVIMSPNLVSARFVQLAPVYAGGPQMSDGATIPLARTAVPVEWDQIKAQLQRLSTALGPSETDPTGPVGQVVDTAADNLRGQGPNLHQTLTSLSEAMATLSQGRGDLVSVVTNLQTFVTALSQSGQQIVAINDRLATVSTLLSDNSEDLGKALGGLDGALGEVTRFVADNRERLGGSVDGLSAVATTLAGQRDGLAQVLHVAPNALANLDNIYQPAHNAIVSALAPSNFANPVNFVCSAIAAAEQSDAQQGAQSCARYLGPLLNLLRTDYPPLSVNPSRGVTALPGQLTYSTPDLAPPTPAAPAAAPPPAAGPPLPPPLSQLLVPGGPR